MTDKQTAEPDIVKEPVKVEDEDRIVRTAVEREDSRFSLTNGQEKTLERAAAAETAARS